MAAILFLVVTLGLLLAGRAQALAGDDGSALRFQLWQLGLGAVMLLLFLAHFALGTPLPVPAGVVTGIALLAVLAGLALLTLGSRRARDIEDF
jgi:4-amino-4-deoxy-L-arabinose transferase-like glycosyltransferase